ncbi:BatD family protein [Chryseobacterium sp. A321]
MKTRFLFFLVLLVSSLSDAQVSLLADTDKKVLNGKEKFTLYVIQELNGNDLIQETPLRTPDLSKFHVLGQGSVRQTYGDPSTSTVINQLIYEFLLEPKGSGKFKIGSFLVTVNGQIYMTDPFEVTVREGDFNARAAQESSLSKISIEMEIEDKQIYPGEPTMAIVRAYSKDFNQLRRVGKVKFPKSDHMRFKPVAFDKSEIQQKTGVSSQVIGMALVIPKEPGSFAVPPVTVNVMEGGNRTHELRSSSVRLHVKDLPSAPPKGYKGAVGDYKLTLVPSLKQEPLQVGKAIPFELRLTGAGNLSRTMLPHLSVTGESSMFRPEVTTRILGGKRGLDGYVSAKYLLIPKVAGRFQVASMPFVYFNPKDGQFHSLDPSPVVVNVLTEEEIKGSRSAIEKVNEYTNSVLETVNTPIVQTTQFKIEEKDKFNWKALLSNYTLIAVFLAVILLFYSLFRRLMKSDPKTGRVDLGSVHETEQKIRREMEMNFDSLFSELSTDANNGNRDAFFEGLEELDAKAQQKIAETNPKGLKSQFEVQFGAMAAEEYRDFRQKVKIEKYAPAHAAEPLEGLYQQAERIYTKIV